MCNAGSGRPSQSCGDGWELRVMIEIEVQKNKYAYNVYHLVKAFFPGEEVVQKINGKQETLAEIRMPEGSCFSIAPEGTNPDAGDVRDIQREKREVTRRVYRILSDYTGRKLAWGILTGVRPTKLAMQRLEKETEAGGHPDVDVQKRVVSYLEEEYFVSREKAVLAYQVARREQELLSRLDCRNGFSLYAGIPFCPSVCSYCSFSSSPLEKWKDRVDAYLDALIKEIRALSQMAAGRRLDTVYIGGGTPTTLEPEQLERLLGSISEAFDLEGALEFTVEAGRPDSITEEKLAVLKQYPVSRISINPQTMQQKTLDLVGRRHTVQQTADAFHMARALGFANINMDLIAGLPGETAEDMRDTIQQIEELRPDSLTVHSLAIKRAARMGQEGRTADLHTEISRMVDDAAAGAARMGLVPYYLYRQKNIAGNFENVGYAEVDKAGIYNILIMEEKQTILAAGAGASTKFVLPEKTSTGNGKETDLIRVENVKNIEEYISRIDEMIERKAKAADRSAV